VRHASPGVRAAAAAWVGLLAGCAGERGPAAAQAPYEPDRRDYTRFQAAHPDLLEPNYLPFMLHRVRGDGPDGDALVFCRWSRDAMPLAVYIAPPEIPDALQDEFSPVRSEAYVDAVVAALSMWERDLEGLVGFRRVATAAEAQLALRLIAAPGPTPEPDLTVLGSTPFGGACTARGRVSGASRLDVRFSVPQADLYIADEFGLLGADQVQWVALHEIGHALGMRNHSPIPADLMYEVVRDRVQVKELSTEDVNSFVSLYQLENGTVFTHLAPGRDAAAERERTPPLGGSPALAMAPYVDARLGFEIRPPAGWLRLETARGMVAIDGLTWDNSASFQVIVERYPTIEAYLDRFGAYYLARGDVLEWEFKQIGSFRGLDTTVVASERHTLERYVFIEVGDGRLFVTVMDSALEDAAAYRPWFEAALTSLVIWMGPESGPPSRRRIQLR